MKKLIEKLGGDIKPIIRIFIAMILLATGMIVMANVDVASDYIWLAIFLPAYFIIGYDVLFRAVTNIARGKVFDEYFLMTIATVGAFAIGEYPEAVAVMLFYQVGEFFQHLATDKSRKSIAELMDIRPDYANIIRDGVITQVDPFDVTIGDLIVIKTGEKVPLDCLVIEGSCALDTCALTGEAMPRDVEVGCEILSGSVNLSGVLTARVIKEYGESTASRILELVESSSSNKSSQETFISKFAKYYTPLVVVAALIIAIIPPLFVGGWIEWLSRALTFLVVSCPCALVISVPMSFFAGIGNASRNGVLIKGGNYLEALAASKVLVLDKTGTITRGMFSVTKILTDSMTDNELLEIAAHAEGYSSHPIALSLRAAYGLDIDLSRVCGVVENAGFGLSSLVDGKSVIIGSSKIMDSNNIDYLYKDEIGTICHVAVEGVYVGAIVISDEIKENSRLAIENVKAVGIKKVVMLTGDKADTAHAVAESIGIDEVFSELLPTDKVEILERLLSELDSREKLIFVGDGINDAPVLARADIGISMGGIGSDSAVQASDIVLIHDDLTKIADSIRLSRKTLSIVRQNIFVSITVKLIVLVLSVFGLANMWLAVFADVGVAVLAILNAMRLIKYNPSKIVVKKQSLIKSKLK